MKQLTYMLILKQQVTNNTATLMTFKPSH